MAKGKKAADAPVETWADWSTTPAETPPPTMQGGDFDEVQPSANETTEERPDGSAVLETPNADALYRADGGPIPPGARVSSLKEETKAQKFKRLAERRVNLCVHRIEQLIPLANRAAYDWSAQDADQIIGALKDAVDKVRRAFEGQHEARVAFRLR